MPLYDRQQEAHYNLISALHKSVRGSDPDAALYWLARMLAGGEDPRYVARRLVRMAIRGHRPRRSVGAAARDRGEPGVRAARQPRGRAGAGAVHDPSGERAQVERRLPRFRRRLARRAGERLADAAGAHPERPDPAHEAARLRPRLRLRPRCARALLGPGLLPRRHGARDLLSADRGGRGGQDQAAARGLGRSCARRAGRGS